MWSPCPRLPPTPTHGLPGNTFPQSLDGPAGVFTSLNQGWICLEYHCWVTRRALPHKDHVPSQSLAQHVPHGPVRGLAADLGKPCPDTRSQPPFRSHPWAHPLQKTAVLVPHHHHHTAPGSAGGVSIQWPRNVQGAAQREGHWHGGKRTGERNWCQAVGLPPGSHHGHSVPRCVGGRGTEPGAAETA